MPTADIVLLAVENDSLQTRILRHELRALGYGLAGTARTADEAETLFEALQPDLVLLDVHLDGPRDGIETAAALVARRRVPLIFITAFPDNQTFARARQVGPFAFLGKPYNGPLLGHSIELALQHFAGGLGLPAADDSGELAEGTVLRGSIFVREQHRFVKLPLDQMLLLEADGNHTHLRTPTRKFTLRLPELVFCELDEAFGRTEPDEEIQDLLRASTGQNLALHFLSGASTFDPLVTTVAPALASMVVWLDCLTLNVDRTARNTNMLLWHKELWLIDHGAALYVHHTGPQWVQSATRPFPSVKDHVLLPQATELAAADAKGRARLTPAVLAAIIATIPDEWLTEPDLTPAEQRANYQQFLENRLAISATFTQEADHARQALV